MLARNMMYPAMIAAARRHVILARFSMHLILSCDCLQG